MSNNFDEFVAKLQKEIIRKDIKDHSKKIVKLFHNPQNWGKPPIEEITVYEESQEGQSGEFLGLYLKIKKDIIVKANFLTDGCGVMIATASQLTIMVTGKPIDFAKKLKPVDLINTLKGIPPDELYCVNFTLKTLKNSIKKYKDIK
ncbi:MAG: iron-sulfur cluster assembly scaffold protein [Candidatus Hermodarchaeota archaeon]